MRYADCNELYRDVEERKKRSAIQPIFYKLVVVERLREANKLLAPVRAANQVKRATGDVEIPIKTR